LDYLKVSLR